MNPSLRWIPYGSPAYALCVALRTEVLRRPLGLHFTEASLAEEQGCHHLAVFDGDSLVACLLLQELGPDITGQVSIQMRQVAVDPALQRSGLGRLMVLESEAEARRRGFTRMVLHARDTAVPFYERLGYAKVGQPFVEVGIGHQEMAKLVG